MPIYELKCDSCGQVIEKLARMDTQLSITCPQCNGAMRQVFSPSVLFWGKGWGRCSFGLKRHFSRPQESAKY